jgi:hypothetical protein
LKKTTPTASASASGSGANKDDLSPSHLRWLVASRAANQAAALRLFTLLSDHVEEIKTKELSTKAQHLVAACFSLWRAAFLADKATTRSEVQAAARTFLAKMLIDNAITYPQDRSTRNWTFNYYMNNATNELVQLSRDWPDIATVLNQRLGSNKSTTRPQRRWNRTELAFERALNCLKDALK